MTKKMILILFFAIELIFVNVSFAKSKTHDLEMEIERRAEEETSIFTSSLLSNLFDDSTNLYFLLTPKDTMILVHTDSDLPEKMYRHITSKIVPAGRKKYSTMPKRLPSVSAATNKLVARLISNRVVSKVLGIDERKINILEFINRTRIYHNRKPSDVTKIELLENYEKLANAIKSPWETKEKDLPRFIKIDNVSLEYFDLKIRDENDVTSINAIKLEQQEFVENLRTKLEDLNKQIKNKYELAKIELENSNLNEKKSKGSRFKVFSRLLKKALSSRSINQNPRGDSSSAHIFKARGKKSLIDDRINSTILEGSTITPV